MDARRVPPLAVPWTHSLQGQGLLSSSEQQRGGCQGEAPTDRGGTHSWGQHRGQAMPGQAGPLPGSPALPSHSTPLGPPTPTTPSTSQHGHRSTTKARSGLRCSQAWNGGAAWLSTGTAGELAPPGPQVQRRGSQRTHKLPAPCPTHTGAQESAGRPGRGHTGGAGEGRRWRGGSMPGPTCLLWHLNI